jgi:hypothetical protein
MTDEMTEQQRPPFTTRRKKDRKRPIAIAVVVLVIALAAAAVWWFLIRDDDSSTTAETSISESESSGGAVEIPQDPSLTASATINGLPVDQALEITFGEASELVVTVVNDGNVTMDGITAALEFTDSDGPLDADGDTCVFPTLGPDDSADCTFAFTPTSDMTSVVAQVLGFGPQDQEVDLAVTITLG